LLAADFTDNADYNFLSVLDPRPPCHPRRAADFAGSADHCDPSRGSHG